MFSGVHLVHWSFVASTRVRNGSLTKYHATPAMMITASSVTNGLAAKPLRVWDMDMFPFPAGRLRPKCPEVYDARNHRQVKLATAFITLRKQDGSAEPAGASNGLIWDLRPLAHVRGAQVMHS